MIKKREKDWTLWKPYVKVKFYHTTQKPRVVEANSGLKETNALINKEEMLKINKRNKAEKKIFKELWVKFPHQRNTKKTEAKANYMKQELSDKEILDEVRLINREINTKTEKWEDHKYLQAMERWIRDLVIPNQATQEERLKNIVFKIMDNKWDDRKKQATDFISDFWKERADKYRKLRSQKNKIALKLKN